MALGKWDILVFAIVVIGISILGVMAFVWNHTQETITVADKIASGYVIVDSNYNVYYPVNVGIYSRMKINHTYTVAIGSSVLPVPISSKVKNIDSIVQEV